MPHIQHITVDGDTIVEITWEVHNQSGQVIERFSRRITMPPKAVRDAELLATADDGKQRNFVSMPAGDYQSGEVFTIPVPPLTFDGKE